MPTYTPAQVAAAMRRAGFPESEIATGVAVATAESGRRSEATNPGTKETPEYSIGPWQINLNAHGKAIDEDSARDLGAATDYAYRLWKSSGWRPWGVYTRGTYREHLPLGQRAAGEAEPEDDLMGPAGRGGGGVEPGSPGRSTGLAANYLERAKTDLEGASTNIAEVHDPTWRSDFIARKQHDPAFRAAALKKYAPRYTDIDDEEAWDAAAKAADDEIQLETNRRQAAYEKAKDDLKAALSLPSETEQDLDLRLKIAQLDKALNPPGPNRTPEQRARDIAAAQESVFRTEALLPAQAAEFRARTARIPAQAERDLAAAEKAAAETAKIQRDLIPKQQRVLQEGWQTIARIKDELASGRITPQEADQYYTSVQQYVTSGLRGSTPADEDKLRIQEATKRAQIGKDILNQQVQSGTALAGNLSRDYQQLLAKTLEPPGEYDPLQRASLFTAGMGGGLQNPSTLDISGQLIGGLAGGGAPMSMPPAPQAGMNWAQDYPGVPLASAVPAGAGAAAMGGEEIPEDAEMSAEDYSRILAEVFTEEEDQAEDEEEYEE